MPVSSNLFGWIVEFWSHRSGTNCFASGPQSSSDRLKNGNGMDTLVPLGIVIESTVSPEAVFVGVLNGMMSSSAAYWRLPKVSKYDAAVGFWGGEPFSPPPEGVDATSASHAQQRRGSVAQSSFGPRPDHCPRRAAI